MAISITNIELPIEIMRKKKQILTFESTESGMRNKKKHEWIKREKKTNSSRSMLCFAFQLEREKKDENP